MKKLHQRAMAAERPSVAREKDGLSSSHYQRAVAELAYGLWEKRGSFGGSSDADWFTAEATLKPLWSADVSYASNGPVSENSGKL